MISAICAEFGIAPNEAAEQDWLLVSQVFDFRMIERGIEYIDKGTDGMKELAKNETMQAVLLEMHRAQAPETTMDEMMAGMSDKADVAEQAKSDVDDME